MMALDAQPKATMVRAFTHMPGYIFIGYQTQHDGKGYLQIMSSSNRMNVEDPHGSELTDILYHERAGSKIVFTACRTEMRAYTISDTSKLERRVTVETKNNYVTKIIPVNQDFLVCGMSDGSFMGWDLASDQKIPTAGHAGQNLRITSLSQHATCILSADNAGTIQVRDFNAGFALATQQPLNIMSQQLCGPRLPFTKPEDGCIDAQTVIPLRNKPFIFTTTKSGFISILNPENGNVIALGAHNDTDTVFGQKQGPGQKGSKMHNQQLKQRYQEIENLLKVEKIDQND